MLSRFDMWPALCLMYLSESKQTRDVRLAEWEDQLPDVCPVREHAQVQNIGTSPPGQRSCPSDRFPAYIGRNAASAFSAPPPNNWYGPQPHIQFFWLPKNPFHPGYICSQALWRALLFSNHGPVPAGCVGCLLSFCVPSGPSNPVSSWTEIHFLGRKTINSNPRFAASRNQEFRKRHLYDVHSTEVMLCSHPGVAIDRTEQ